LYFAETFNSFQCFSIKIIGFANVDEAATVTRYFNVKWKGKDAPQTTSWVKLGRTGHGEFGKLDTGEKRAGVIRHLCLAKVTSEDFRVRGITPEIIEHGYDLGDEVRTALHDVYSNKRIGSKACSGASS